MRRRASTETLRLVEDHRQAEDGNQDSGAEAERKESGWLDLRSVSVVIVTNVTERLSNDPPIKTGLDSAISLMETFFYL